jgi:hypothetical protein
MCFKYSIIAASLCYRFAFIAGDSYPMRAMRVDKGSSARPYNVVLFTCNEYHRLGESSGKRNSEPADGGG